MRCLLLILLVLAAPARRAFGQEGVLLLEERAWKGVIEITAVSQAPERVKGEERQTERIEFVLVTKPPRRTVAMARLPFALRDVKGEWRLAVDTRDGEGENAVKTKGRGAGRLHARVGGWVEPGSGKYRLGVDASPGRLTAPTTMSGIWKGRFTTWRTVTSRTPFLAGFRAEGKATEQGRVLAGKREFLDRKSKYPRQVEITWRVERLDPVVAGRVTDQHGTPLGGLEVKVWTINPARARKGLPPLAREGETDADGRFRIDVFLAHWNVEVLGAVRGPRVIRGRRLSEGAAVGFADVPFLDVKLDVYRRSALPRGELLDRHFRGDVKGYFEWIAQRASARRLAAALAPPAER